MISLVAAVDENDNIGLNGDMPWGRSQPTDLEQFRKLTHGHTLIMGRKTFESLPGILPGRKHLVLTQKGLDIDHPMVETFYYPEALLASIGWDMDFGSEPMKEEVFVIGGAQIYEEFFPCADNLYLTRIHASLEGDTKFPKFQGSWSSTEENRTHLPASAKNRYPMTFVKYERVWT